MKTINLTLNAPSYSHSEFLATINKLEKAAIKANIEPLKVTKLSSGKKRISKNKEAEEEILDFKMSVETAMFYMDTRVLVIDYTTYLISGELPLVKGDWIIKGLVDFTEGTTPVVKSFLGEELDKKYRTTSHNCDHCNTSRKRNKVFILSNNETELQVGETCLDKFTGDKLTRKIASFADLFSMFVETYDKEEGWGYSYAKPEYSLKNFLTLCLLDSEKSSFVTKAQASESTPSTAEWIMILLNSRDSDNNKYLAELIKSVTPEHTNIINSIIDKHIDSFNTETQSDFDYRMSQIATNGTVTESTAGIAAYMIGSYLREQENNRLASESNNAPRPEPIKTRVKKEVLKFIKSIMIETFYGINYITIFKDSENRTLVTKSANVFNKDMVADFTIKDEPREYNGVIQTPITRVKCVEILDSL